MSDKDRANILCPKCQIPTQVLDSRGAPDNMIRRRRRCSDCGERITTYEEIYERGQAERRAKQARSLMSELADLLGVGRFNE